MKYVLTGMGLLRINLENPKNRVRGIMYHVPTMSSYVKCFNDVQFIQTNRLRYSDTNISVHIEIVCLPMMALPFFAVLSLNYDMMLSYSYSTNSKENPSY